MRRYSIVVLALLVCLTFTSCGKQQDKEEKEPSESQMRAICELAVMECYYHNVAKYFEEDASGVWLWKKDKNFWIEYSGSVRVGIDATQLEMNIKDNVVEITIPKAKILSCKVDQTSLTEDSFIIAEDSAKVKAEDQQKAMAEAQDNMKEEAENDTMLLANAQERVKCLLEEYVKNIGIVIGKEYTISWKYKGTGDIKEKTDNNELETK